MITLPRIQAALGGIQAEEATEEALQSLVGGRVREDAEIEFKGSLYGHSDRDRRSLATDVAALANGVGGVIFVGIREEGGIAAELTSVLLQEEEELRMRQIVAELVAPAPDIYIVRIDTTEAGNGYYLLVVPLSAWRPHAVRVNAALRYPRRDGPRIRYLSETEVADAYRGRFTAEAAQRQRLDQVHSDGLERLGADTLWLTAALVPDVPGEMRLDRRAIQEFRSFAERYSGGFGSMIFGGFDITTGLRRIVVRTGPEVGLSTIAHAELHMDGSAFAASSVWDLRSGRLEGRLPGNEETPWLEDEYLVVQMVGLVSLAMEHASSHCRVSGNAAVRASVDGYDRGDGHFKYPARLIHRRRFGLAEPRSRVEVARPPVSLHTVDVAACSGSTRELLIACRQALTDLFQSFGVPEVEQINEDGALRRRYFREDMQRVLKTWAGTKDVDVLDSTLEEEARPDGL